MTQVASSAFSVVEICAGAGGQSLGLHQAGFDHSLAVEIDETAAHSLEQNIHTTVAVGDVASPDVWTPSDYDGVTLFAGGVPCPPFSAAGKQLGSSDERDLFAWAVEQVSVIRPRAVMLENVRGLSAPRFSAYRQRILDRLDAEGYVAEWKLLYSADYGVPQLRPRFVLVAMAADDHKFFRWPEPTVAAHVTVGEALGELMGANGWRHAEEWSRLADGVGPTLVGGSKKHGGADLGPTRAKEGWKRLFVDGRGVANSAPDMEAPSATVVMPKLTIEMTARIQGWMPEDNWQFAGRKTSQYRQIGNAFPPPVARAVGDSIAAALRHEGIARDESASVVDLHDPVYRALARSDRPLSMADLLRAENEQSQANIERKLAAIQHDFHLEVLQSVDGSVSYRLGDFKGFTGQDDHMRHDFVTRYRNRVS